MYRLICAACAAVLWGTLVVGAPQPAADQTPTISVETNLVMLPVTVLDRRDEFVAGLTQDRFTVYDNGEPPPIHFFTNEDVPATVRLLIDSSASMRTRRNDVTAAAAAFTASAHPLDELFTVNFNEAVWPGLPGGVRFAANSEQLHRAVSRSPAYGMTAVYDAVNRGLDYLDLGTRERKALILVSDGGDNASRLSLDTVLEHARRDSAVIYTVTIADPDTHDARPDVLKKFAQATGGSSVSPKDSADVVAAFARISREIRSGYMLGVTPPSVANGGFRTIRVVVDAGDGRKLTVRTRAGYYAARSANTQ